MLSGLFAKVADDTSRQRVNEGFQKNMDKATPVIKDYDSQATCLTYH